MARPGPETSLVDLAAKVVGDNPQLQSRVATFVSDVLDLAEDILDNGTPKMQADIVGKLVPHLVRQMAEKAEDDDIRQMREAHNELRAQMRSMMTGQVIQVTDGDTTGADLSDVERARLDAVLAVMPKDTPPASVTPINQSRIVIKGKTG